MSLRSHVHLNLMESRWGLCTRREVFDKETYYLRFLFVLCAEGLSALFDAWERQRRIQGVSVSKEAPNVHHLLFADDSFIFVRSSLQECLEVKHLLKDYENASGQAVNYQKSYVAFSENLNEYDY